MSAQPLGAQCLGAPHSYCAAASQGATAARWVHIRETRTWMERADRQPMWRSNCSIFAAVTLGIAIPLFKRTL